MAFLFYNCGALLSLIFIIGSNDVLAAQSTNNEPMVAFVCNRGAMYMDQELGWQTDGLVGCLEEKQNILEYCQHVYPKMDVRNIVETTQEMIIEGWCPIGEVNCRSPDTFTVQTYRCLTGVYQSDTLVVPDNCKFGHVHESDKCKDFTFWHELVSNSCLNESGMVAHSCGMLLPCGTDLWTGVEYVCCSSDESILERSEEDTVNRYLYLQLIGGQYSNEHDVFELAKGMQEEINKEKTEKMMKEWYDARDRVIALQAIDHKQAEKLNIEISERYSKRYMALQKEEDKAMKELDDVHQQHVQVNLNHKKRVSMQKLMEELQSDVHQIDDISVLLQNYISVEQKDAVHCVKHFVKVRARDPLAARELLPATIEHLTLISMRINQSIDLLDTLGDKDTVDTLKVNTWLWVRKSSFNIDETVELLTALPEPKETVTRINSDKITTAIPSNRVATAAPRDPSTFVAINHPPGAEKAVSVNESGETDEINLETEGSADSVDAPEDTELEQLIGLSENWHPGAVVAVTAAGVIMAMMVVVCAVLSVKKKSGKKLKRFTHTYLEVSPDNLKPEDRHIVTMQNGYENPTYALLEQKKL